MFKVKTKGTVVGAGPDIMQVLCNTSGNAKASATRADGVWTVTNGTDTVTVNSRSDAIVKLVDLAKGDTPNYTAQVTPGLADLP